MISRFKQVGLDQLAPGAVLAADVLDQQGGILLPKGAALNEPLLRALRRRGIDSLRVRDDTVDPALLAAERARAGLRLAQLFRHPGPAAADALLREQVTRHRLDALE